MEDKWTRIQRVCSVVTAASCVVILLLMIVLFAGMGRALKTIKTADTLLVKMSGPVEDLSKIDIEKLSNTLDELSEAVDQAELAETLSSLHDITAELREADLKELSLQAKETLAEAEETLESAKEAIDAMDVEGLKEAVNDLQSILEPLLKLANRF